MLQKGWKNEENLFVCAKQVGPIRGRPKYFSPNLKHVLCSILSLSLTLFAKNTFQNPNFSNRLKSIKQRFLILRLGLVSLRQNSFVK